MPEPFEKTPDQWRMNHKDFKDVYETTFAKGTIIDFKLLNDNPIQVDALVKVEVDGTEYDDVPLFFRPKDGYWDTEDAVAKDFDSDKKCYKQAWMSFQGRDDAVVMLQKGVPVAVIGFYDGYPRIGENVFKIEWTAKKAGGDHTLHIIVRPQNPDDSHIYAELDEEPESPDGLDLGLKQEAKLIYFNSYTEETAGTEGYGNAFQFYWQGSAIPTPNIWYPPGDPRATFAGEQMFIWSIRGGGKISSYDVADYLVPMGGTLYIVHICTKKITWKESTLWLLEWDAGPMGANWQAVHQAHRYTAPQTADDMDWVNSIQSLLELNPTSVKQVPWSHEQTYEYNYCDDLVWTYMQDPWEEGWCGVVTEFNMSKQSAPIDLNIGTGVNPPDDEYSVNYYAVEAAANSKKIYEKALNGPDTPVDPTDDAQPSPTGHPYNEYKDFTFQDAEGAIHNDDNGDVQKIWNFLELHPGEDFVDPTDRDCPDLESLKIYIRPHTKDELQAAGMWPDLSK